MAEETPNKSTAKAAVKSEWPKFLKVTGKYGMTDPETKIRFGAAVPVKIDAEPREGSWLDCQIKAGLIGEG